MRVAGRCWSHNFLHRRDRFQFGRQFQALGPINQTVLGPNQPLKPMHIIEMWKVLLNLQSMHCIGMRKVFLNIQSMHCIGMRKLYIKSLLHMDERRREDLEMDCLVKVFEKVGMESLLLDVPFVCKSWYKATLNPSCWQLLIFPDNKCIEVWPWDVSECPDFQNLMDGFASEYDIDGDRCSVTAF
ncbi:unnamed protein product [Prunus brigantina]